MSVGAGIHKREWTGTIGGTAVVLVEQSLSISNSRGDTSGDTSGEWADAHATPTQKSISFTGSGVTRNNSLLKSAMQTGSQAYAVVLTCTADDAGTSGSVISGGFFLDSFEDSGSVGELMQFSLSMSSTGAATFTDPVA